MSGYSGKRGLNPGEFSLETHGLLQRKVHYSPRDEAPKAAETTKSTVFSLFFMYHSLQLDLSLSSLRKMKLIAGNLSFLKQGAPTHLPHLSAPTTRPEHQGLRTLRVL